VNNEKYVFNPILVQPIICNSKVLVQNLLQIVMSLLKAFKIKIAFKIFAQTL